MKSINSSINRNARKRKMTKHFLFYYCGNPIWCFKYSYKYLSCVRKCDILAFPFKKKNHGSQFRNMFPLRNAKEAFEYLLVFDFM